jgi:hypothetical protein
MAAYGEILECCSSRHNRAYAWTDCIRTGSSDHARNPADRVSRRQTSVQAFVIVPIRWVSASVVACEQSVVTVALTNSPSQEVVVWFLEGLATPRGDGRSPASVIRCPK